MSRIIGIDFSMIHAHTELLTYIGINVNKIGKFNFKNKKTANCLMQVSNLFI